MGGKYYRIQRQPYTDKYGNSHGKEYVGIDLKTPHVSGSLRKKAAKEEWNRLTHFAMTFKKGTV